jgi:hypothetical protein
MMIKVALTTQTEPKAYSEKRFEEIFGISYFRQLKFVDWRIEHWIRKKCAWADRKGKIGDLARWLGRFHANAIDEAEIPQVSIRWINEKIGYGLFADGPIKQWEYIGEYTGLLRRRRLIFPDLNDYCFMYPSEWIALKALTIDSAQCGNYTRYINHSDIPNLESVSVFHKGIFHIIFRAIQDISPETQLTYDYGDIYWTGRRKITEKNI